MRILALTITISFIHIMTVGKVEPRDVINAVFQGTVEADGQTENDIKHRINAGDKANDANDKTVPAIFDNEYYIPLGFQILESNLPLYRFGLGSRLTYELTFADYSDVIKASDPDASYTISNISLQFDTVTNASLASQIRTEYMKSSTLFLEPALYHSTISVQAFQWISIARQKVSSLCYSFYERKKRH